MTGSSMQRFTLELPGAEGPVCYGSEQVHCDRHNEPAVISIVARTDARGPIRFVLWCSLRGAGSCDEHCLRSCPRR